MTEPALPPWLRRCSDGAVTLQILVAPRSSRDRLGAVVGDRLKIAVTAPALEGKANAAVIKLLARALKVRRADLTIVAGERSKRKTVRLAGGDAAVVLELGGAAP